MKPLKFSSEALELARAIGQPFTLAFALEHRAWLCNQCRLASEARAAAEEEIEIATEQGFPYWLAVGHSLQGGFHGSAGAVARSDTSDPKGPPGLRATGAGLDLTLHLRLSRQCLHAAGQLADAAKALDEGLANVEKTDERFYESRLHRLRGEMLLTESPMDAEAEFCNAIKTARLQHSKALELRAATSLARLWHKQGRGNEARAALSAVYGTFAEGFRTPDLQDAKALLETLGNEHMREDFAAGVKYVLGCIRAS